MREIKTKSVVEEETNFSRRLNNFIISSKSHNDYSDVLLDKLGVIKCLYLFNVMAKEIAVCLFKERLLNLYKDIEELHKIVISVNSESVK